MNNKITRDQLNNELAESISVELESAVTELYRLKLCIEYFDACENNSSEFVVYGSHPSERIECNLNKKTMTYYSGFAVGDIFLHIERTTMFCRLLMDFSSTVNDDNDDSDGEWELTTCHASL